MDSCEEVEHIAVLIEQKDREPSRVRLQTHGMTCYSRTARTNHLSMVKKISVLIPHPNSLSDPSLVPPPPETSKVSWCPCNSFATLNKVTSVPSFPTDNLASKQSKMSGFSWYVGIDLAAVYHTCPICKSNWAYTAFHAEDRGIYAWVCTPFGLTGAGNTVNKMIEMALKEQIGKDLESLMDDICKASNDWDKLFATLHQTLELCHENDLIIAPSKMKLFVHKLLWGGVRAGHGSRSFHKYPWEDP